jgi:hypothetical protein
MENENKIFLEKINEFIVFSKNSTEKDEIKSKYLKELNVEIHKTFIVKISDFMSFNVLGIRRFCDCDKGTRSVPLSQKCGGVKPHKGR